MGGFTLVVSVCGSRGFGEGKETATYGFSYFFSLLFGELVLLFALEALLF